MAMTRPVPVDYWLKQNVNEQYSLEDKLLYVYLITNEHTQQLGIYKITFKTISNELNMPMECVETSMYNLEYRFNIIRYSKKTNEVAILDYFTFGILKGGEPIRKCFSNITKKVDDKSLLAYLYIYSTKFPSDMSTYGEVLQSIRNILPYTDKELESMDEFQKPIITYFYDENGNKYDVDNIAYNEYKDIFAPTSCSMVVKVRCYDDKYRYVKTYYQGEQEIRNKKENTEFVVFVDYQLLEEQHKLCAEYYGTNE